MMKLPYIFSLLALFSSPVIAYESMHEKTPVGQIKVLNLPTRVALEASTNLSYFDENNGLFRKLFRYIGANDISMTTPVEADINPGKMRFFVGNKDLKKKFGDSEQVKVKNLPPTKVISIGIRGGYTEKRFLENEQKLLDWLSNNKAFIKSGDAYGVYWNGPFVPSFMKRSEVHLPVKAKTKQNQKIQN